MTSHNHPPKIGHSTTSGMNGLFGEDFGAYAEATAARKEREEQARALAATQGVEVDAVPTQPRGSRLLSTAALKRLIPKPKPSTGRHVATRS